MVYVTSPARRLTLAIVFTMAAIWESYWIYEYVAAPRPDYEMRSVMALFLGGILPGVVVCSILVVALVNSILRRR
jgi:hypothetical protein